MAAGGEGDRSLQETPTWAVAVVCAAFVIISLLIEHGIHSLGHWFQKRQKKAMTEALEKIKAELMLLGFISLLITVGTTFISKICIPAHLGQTMLPCKYDHKQKDAYGGRKDDDGGDHDRRKLLSYAENMIWRRGLAGPAGEDYCSEHGKISLISQTAVHQLHIFIFVLAVFHVLYSVVTVALAKAKMKRWKAWESETSTFEYQFTNDPTRLRFTHQTSFVRRHSGMSTIPGIKWIVAFFRQFFGSISKVDYLTMRHGFINAHFAPDTKFDFHKYIKRSMEDDFKVVVGISMPLWFFAVIFLLLNVYKWYTLTYLSFVPLIILLLVGTKLELVIMEMAQEIQERSTVIKGAPVVEPNNKYFWFNRPDWILHLIHFTLFQNAFEMAYFFWICVEFGVKSCFHENLFAILTRVILGVILQIICSYITFPLHALVTQMGSHMKKAIFEEQTANALKKWQRAAKERRKLRKAGGEGSSGFISGENTPSLGASPIHLLHNHNYRSNQADIESAVSPRSCLSDTELSEIEGSNHNVQGSRTQEHQVTNEELDNDDFTFVKL